MAAPGSVAPLFGVNFVGNSFPVFEPALTRVDQTHWVLDVCTSVLHNYWELKELMVFLVQPGMLPPDMALGVYVKTGLSEWVYRGCVHAGHPSEVMPIQWPQPDSGPVPPGPGAAQIGISIEPGAEIIHKEGSKVGAKEDFAKRVGMDLFRYMESFQTQAMGDHIIVPANVLDRWFIKFSDKFRRDPDFLTRDTNKL